MLLAIAVAVGACSEKSSSIKIDVATPADVGRSLCAIFKSGSTDLLGHLLPWSDQVAGCNSMHHLAECRRHGWSPGVACTIPKKVYAECSEETLKAQWKDFAGTLARAKASCAVERPTSGELDEVDIVILGTRETLPLMKLADGSWKVADNVLLSEIQMAVMDEKQRQTQDDQSGFSKREK